MSLFNLHHNYICTVWGHTLIWSIPWYPQPATSTTVAPPSPPHTHTHTSTRDARLCLPLNFKYSITPLIRINRHGEPSEYAENPDNWIFNLNKNAKWMYFVLKSLQFFIYIIPLYMFRTPLCPSSGASQLHMQSLVPCGAWFVVSSSPTMLQHSRTGEHNEPSTTRNQRLHLQLRSSWWWTQWCPKHVERNNVNKHTSLKGITSFPCICLFCSVLPPPFRIPRPHMCIRNTCQS